MLRAGAIRRLPAGLIDQFLIVVIYYLVAILIDRAFPQINNLNDDALERSASGLLGWTLGKRLFRIQIIRADGAPADRWLLATRWLTKWSPYILMAFWGLTGFIPLHVLAGFMSLVICVGLLPMLGEDKRAWHDQWSGTAVGIKPKVGLADLRPATSTGTL